MKRWKFRQMMIALAIAWIVSVPVYLLSIGPALLFAKNGWLSSRTVSIAYRPLLWLSCRSPQPVEEAFDFYMSSWSDRLRIRVEADHVIWELGLDRYQPRSLDGPEYRF